MAVLPMTLQPTECSNKIQLNLLTFTISIASAFAYSGTNQRPTVGCPWKPKSNTDDIWQSVKMRSVVLEPVEDERYNNIGH